YYNSTLAATVHTDVGFSAWKNRIKNHPIHVDMIFCQAAVELLAVHVISKTANHVDLPSQFAGSNRLVAALASREYKEPVSNLCFSAYRNPGHFHGDIHIHAAYHHDLLSLLFLGRADNASSLRQYRWKFAHQLHLLLPLDHINKILHCVPAHAFRRKPDSGNAIPQKFRHPAVA